MTKRSALESLILHSLLIILLLLEGAGGGGSGQSGNPSPEKTGSDAEQADNKKITEKPSEKTTIVELVEAEATDGTKPRVEKDCKDNQFYGGLGLYTSPRYDGALTVVTTFPGYPADKIGLKTGDVILYPPAENIIGEVGSHITLKVYKPELDTIVEIKTTREKICVEDSNT